MLFSQQLFDSAIALREKRLDLEEALVEEKKTAETLKKDTDTFSKKAKVMESQLKTALADLEAFQVSLIQQYDDKILFTTLPGNVFNSY